jgi:hypothetical protein
MDRNLEAHTMKTGMLTILGAGALSLAATSCWAQVYNLTLDRPSQDRWMYPFNFSAGQETRASLFGAVLIDGFDDRDSTFIVSWDTGTVVPPGQGATKYRIVSARTKITVQSTTTATTYYDPSAESVRTLYPTNDPEYTPDLDPGKPLEVFGAGFRNGESAASFTEAVAFGCPGPSFNACRSVFPAVYDANGVASDVTNQVRGRFEAAAWGVGQTDALAPGEPMVVDTEFTFDLDLCGTGVRPYLQAALNSGKVILVYSALAPASQSGGGDYARFYTDENPQGPAFGRAAKLELVVRVYEGADFNGDQQVDFFDYLDFAQAFASETPDADFNSDCQVDFFDYLDFAAEFSR